MLGQQLIPPRPPPRKGAPPPFVSKPTSGIPLACHGTPLGFGSHAFLFERYDEKLQRKVATRVTPLFMGRPLPALTVVKMEEECRRFQALDNDNVVKVFGFDYNPDQKCCSLCVELMEQGSAVDYANVKLCRGSNPHSSDSSSSSREAGLSEDKVWSTIKPIISGLQYLHSKGFVHGNIKENSILLDSKGRPKLSGSCTIERLMNLAEPERFEAPSVRQFVFRSQEGLRKGSTQLVAGRDIWGLACLILMLATGRLPWDDICVSMINQTELMLRLLEGQHPTIPPHLSPALKTLLLRMFHQDPEMRPSATELLDSDYFRSECFAYDTDSERSSESTLVDGSC